VSAVRRAALAALLALAAVPASLAADRDPARLPPDAAIPVTPELLMLGAEVFRERCSPCHGDRGHGDGLLAEVLPIRPRNYFEESFRWGHRPEEIAETVRRGRSNVMPAFQHALTQREIWAVSNLVHLWATGVAAPIEPPGRR
jgi:mono/diheme cytochrome c family protein